MAKSKSKKRLEHKLKNGLGFDPRVKRGDWGVGNGVSKQTPTLQTKLRKNEKRYGNRYGEQDNNHSDFYLCL